MKLSSRLVRIFSTWERSGDVVYLTIRHNLSCACVRLTLWRPHPFASSRWMLDPPLIPSVHREERAVSPTRVWTLHVIVKDYIHISKMPDDTLMDWGAMLVTYKCCQCSPVIVSNLFWQNSTSKTCKYKHRNDRNKDNTRYTFVVSMMEIRVVDWHDDTNDGVVIRKGRLATATCCGFPSKKYEMQIWEVFMNHCHMGLQWLIIRIRLCSQV